MGLESITSGAASTIQNLNPDNPLDGDLKREGAAHIRNSKKALLLTFPNVDATVSASPAELNLAHEGGTISGSLMVKGRIDAAYVEATATSSLNGLIVTDKLRCNELTVTGVAGFYEQADFHATVSATHIIAGNFAVARFQGSATLISRSRNDISASLVGVGQYKVTHPYSGVYVSFAQPQGSGGQYATVELVTGGNQTNVFIYDPDGTAAASGFQMLFYEA